MDVGIVVVLLAGGVVGDVSLLGVEVFAVADAVLEVAGVLDLAGVLLAHGVGVAAFDELDRPRRGDVNGWRDEDMDVLNCSSSECLAPSDQPTSRLNSILGDKSSFSTLCTV